MIDKPGDNDGVGCLIIIGIIMVSGAVADLSNGNWGVLTAGVLCLLWAVCSGIHSMYGK